MLGVNVDHVATIRQARYALVPDSPNAEPSVVEAARDAEAAGAASITVHLRADRRHVQDADVFALREAIAGRLNFEMGNTPEIAEIALRVRPHSVCLVPETREEITTEGGLDVVAHGAAVRATIERMRGAGIIVSLFIDAVPDQVRAAADCGADVIELHTGPFANAAPGDGRGAEVRALAEAAGLAHGMGLRVNAGHGLTTGNLPALFEVPHLEELNIGHHLVARSVRIGLRAAVREMLDVMALYPGAPGGA